MPRQVTRHFQLVDALVLVAAAAIGLAGARALFSETEWATSTPWDSLPLPISTFQLLRRAALWSLPLAKAPLLSATLAVLLLRLRAPRPSRRLLWGQPGLLASSAVVFAYVWDLAGLLLLVIVPEVLKIFPAIEQSFDFGDAALGIAMLLRDLLETTLVNFVLTANVGLAVSVAWAVAWGVGRCRPEPSWVDRSGRVLGVAWIAVSLLAFAKYAT